LIHFYKREAFGENHVLSENNMQDVWITT